MVLSSVFLFKNTTHARSVLPDHDEQIFRKEASLCVFVDDFNVGKPLLIGAHFILALNDQFSFFS